MGIKEVLTEKVLPVAMPLGILAAPVAGYYSGIKDLPEDAHPHVRNVRHITGGGSAMMGVPGAALSALTTAAKGPVVGGIASIPLAGLSFMLGRNFGRMADKEQQNAVRLIRRNNGMLLGQEKEAGVGERLAGALAAGVPGALGGALGGAGLTLAGSDEDTSGGAYAEAAMRGALVGGILSAITGGAVGRQGVQGLGEALPLLGLGAGAATGAVPGALRGLREDM